MSIRFKPIRYVGRYIKQTARALPISPYVGIILSLLLPPKADYLLDDVYPLVIHAKYSYSIPQAGFQFGISSFSQN